MIGRPFVIFLFFFLLSITAIWFDGEERWGRGEAAFRVLFWLCLFVWFWFSFAGVGWTRRAHGRIGAPAEAHPQRRVAVRLAHLLVVDAAGASRRLLHLLGSARLRGFVSVSPLGQSVGWLGSLV